MIKTGCFIACTHTHTHSHIVRFADAHKHTYVDVASLSLGGKTPTHRILLGQQTYSFLLCTYFQGINPQGKEKTQAKSP